MIDLFLRAGNAGAFASACPWLRGEDENGDTFWLTSGDGFVFDPIGPVVTTPGEYDEDGNEITPPVMDDGFHGNLRCTEEVAARVPETVRIEPSAPRRRFAGEPPAAPVPSIISDRQFFQALAMGGEITADEALAAVKTGEIPAAMLAIVEGLPADQQFGARMLLSGATDFDRDHPMVAAFGRATGRDAAALDDLWRAAAQL